MKETRIKNLLKRSKGSNHEVLFHHRFSTSTADVPNACHPFSTKDFFKNNYVGVHNGVISNDNALEKQQQELGIEYISRQKNGQFNDSEALIYDIAQVLEGQKEELTARGSIAFIMIKRNKDGKAKTLFFGRNTGNPLMMKRTKHSLTLSSQGEGTAIEPNQLYSFDYETQEITKRYLFIPYYSSWSNYVAPKTSPSYNFDERYDGRGYLSGGSDEYGSYDSSGNYCRPDWDNEEALENNKELNANKIISQANFMPRTGLQSVVERDLLIEAGGDYEEAALAAIAEADEAGQEEARINSHIYNVISGDAYDELCDYWYTINAYKTMMTQIYHKFEEASIVRASKGEHGVTVLPEEQSLLSLTA